MSDLIEIRGERYLTLESVASCYGFSLQWVTTVYEHGLLGQGELHHGSIVIAARLLDRLAAIRRLHRHLGIDIAAVDLFLDLVEE